MRSESVPVSGTDEQEVPWAHWRQQRRPAAEDPQILTCSIAIVMTEERSTKWNCLIAVPLDSEGERLADILSKLTKVPAKAALHLLRRALTYIRSEYMQTVR